MFIRGNSDGVIDPCARRATPGKQLALASPVAVSRTSNYYFARLRVINEIGTKSAPN